jgi:glycosyltransferase involved in cell wall biosynthesis
MRVGMHQVTDSAPGEEPLVSVLVCTRNRRENVVPTVRSVLSCGYPNLEIFVLDQSDDDGTQASIAPLRDADARVRYVRLAQPGKPLALNEGLHLSRGRYILLTDDDCEVLPGWIDAIAATFQSDPRIGCIYGAVEAGPHDPKEGFVPDRAIASPGTIFRLRDLLTMPGWGNIGMGASMAVRTDVVTALKGWDPCIGPGTKFGSGDDTDLAVRTLKAGYGVHFSPQARVVHYGFRYWKSKRTDLTRIAFGLGSIAAKHLRCGTLVRGGFRPPYYYLRQATVELLRFRRPAGAVIVLGWVRGFSNGMRAPIDRKTGFFVATGDAQRYKERVAEVVLRVDQ